MFGDAYRNKKVLVTGHTGFKGSWLCLWLQELGAEVLGFALEPSTMPSHFGLLQKSNMLQIQSEIGDVRNQEHLHQVLGDFRPDIVFHLAAQPLVRLSYETPVDTFDTNVLGTLKLYEACRKVRSVQAIVSITTDKVYENREWCWGYREDDPLGGHDPYSASKAAMEIATRSYRNSFFPIHEYGRSHNVLIATARAGNVVGGGDWAQSRLIPDIAKATHQGEVVRLRNPRAVRPWQHVLEPLSGYLLLGEHLLAGSSAMATEWNFGPPVDQDICVEEVVRTMQGAWPNLRFEIEEQVDQPHEAGLLKLDCSKATQQLKWRPLWSFQQTLETTALWYREHYETNRILTLDNLSNYTALGASREAVWA